MKTIKNYNIYIFIVTFIRNIIDVYSCIYLYQLGFKVKAIIYIYALVYFMGAYVGTFSMKLGNKIGYKYILIASSIASSITFYIISNCRNIYLIALCLSLSTFTYHPIRHYYGITMLKNKKDIGNTLICIYLASFLSSYVSIKRINLVYLIIISLLGIIPAMFIKNDDNNKNRNVNVDYQKFKYFFFDQFRIIFILFESLYLYLLFGSMSYVSVFNIILILSSIFCIYILVNKINIRKYYKYINIIFVLILLLKVNIFNKKLLFIIAFLEGIGIKINELVSTINMYNEENAGYLYIIKCEKIFCMIRSLILVIVYLSGISIKTCLYFMIIGIFILSFQYKEKEY